MRAFFVFGVRHALRGAGFFIGRSMCSTRGMVAPKRIELGIQVGDVYAGPLGDGRFGAVHVVEVTKDGVRPGRDSAVIVCTRYVGAQLPTTDDLAVRAVLRRNRFRFRDDPAVMIIHEPPPADFVRVGNFAPTREELAIDPMGTSGAEWLIVRDVLSEWRWEHDREAFEHEVAARASEARVDTMPGPRTPTPNSTLTEAGFWALIEMIEGGDASPLVAALAARDPADIRELHELLAHKLFLLDGRRYAEHAGDAGSSDDAFLYARCAVVARGRAFYEDVLAHPEHFPADADFEELLSVVAEAFLEATGDDFDELSHHSYETGSNVEAWAR
jgi:hypothetical protein